MAIKWVIGWGGGLVNQSCSKIDHVGRLRRQRLGYIAPLEEQTDLNDIRTELNQTMTSDGKFLHRYADKLFTQFFNTCT